jgi:hypothetical protein
MCTKPASCTYMLHAQCIKRHSMANLQVIVTSASGCCRLLLLPPLAFSAALLSPGSPNSTPLGPLVHAGACILPQPVLLSSGAPSLLHAHICCMLNASSGTACPICRSSLLPPAAAHTSSFLNSLPIPRQPIQHPCWIHWCMPAPVSCPTNAAASRRTKPVSRTHVSCLMLWAQHAIPHVVITAC